MSGPFSEPTSLHICLEYGTQSFKGNVKVSGGFKGALEKADSSRALERERMHILQSPVRAYRSPTTHTHTLPDPLGRTGRQMIDRQMNRHPGREIHLAIFSSPNFLKLSYGTDSEAQGGVEGWGLIFTSNHGI